MQAIDLLNCEVVGVASRVDGSVKIGVVTAELRPSEKGLVMEFHGKACRVLIAPHEDSAPEIVNVSTERGIKSPGQRLHAVLYVLFQHIKPGGNFDDFYRAQIENYIEAAKAKLDLFQ